MARPVRGRDRDLAERRSHRLNGELIFEALIVPHRSLTKTGLRWVVTSLAAIAAIVSIRFWMLGAWVVAPFAVAEVGLVLLMLFLNNRQARASELVMLSETEVRIVRTSPSGARREVTIPSGWLSVALEERDGRVPRLTLRHRGVDEEIAAVLGEDAKRDLAAALSGALRRARNPVFDNPQLRA